MGVVAPGLGPGIALEPHAGMVIAFATDLTGDDDAAFVHAVALASVSGARLVSVHAGPPGASSPDAGRLAAGWGRTVAHEFRRVDGDDDDADAIVEALLALRPSLVVLGTHARRGLAALLRGSVGEAIARNLRIPALFVPNGDPGFVDPATGAVILRRILIPVADATDLARGTEAARALLGLLGAELPTLDIVHVGPLDRELVELGATRIDGPLEESIVELARTREVTLIAMTTHGHDGIGDVLGGSHTEHVLRHAKRPVLVVPR